MEVSRKEEIGVIPKFHVLLFMLEDFKKDLVLQHVSVLCCGHDTILHCRGLLPMVSFFEGDTMIMKVVFPGRGLSIALRCTNPCDFPNVGNLTA